MKCLQIITASMILFLGYVACAEKHIYSETHTRTFATPKYHGFPILNQQAKGGVAGGFTVLCAAMLFAAIMIIKEEIDKHKDMAVKLYTARERMRELEMNLPKIDEEYEEYKKNKGKVQDDDKVIQKAAQKKKNAQKNNNTSNHQPLEQEDDHDARL